MTMQFQRSTELRQRAHRAIPGGCHAYAKGDDRYPLLSPGFIRHGKGCHVWDVDGNEFIEYAPGNRSVALGHGFPAVVEAAQRELMHGTNFSRPSVIEVEAAEEFLSLITNAEMVKFCKNGSDATTAALRIARAYTGRELVGFCRDQPFFAANDWFIGTTPLDAGVPQCIADLSLGFTYNDIDSVKALFKNHPQQIAGLIMEPCKYEDPTPGFLEEVRNLCHAHGALFILDEMITGFRWHNGGGQAYYAIDPDLSCWGKALANGFSVSALAGKRKYMELGGIHHETEKVFLLSSTHGGETHALAAAIATIRTYKDEPVIETLHRLGERLKTEGTQIITQHGLSEYVQIQGKPCCLAVFTRNTQKELCQAMRTLLLQETIRRGILMTSLVVSYSHTDEDIHKTLDAIDGAMSIYAKALADDVSSYLVGPPSQLEFRKYNAQDNHPLFPEASTLS